MKTRLLTILMMLAMLAGANVAKADTVTATVTFDSSVWGTTDQIFNSSATDSWTSSGVTMAITGDDTYNSSISSGYFNVNYPGYLTFTAPTGTTLTGLTITGSGDPLSASTGTLTANATSGGYTWSGSASSLTLSAGTDGREYYRFQSIVVTYEADLDILASTTSSGAEYRFHRYATPFLNASLHAKTITAGIQEMYFDGFSASTDPMIIESPTNGSTYLHMPAGSRLRLQGSESGSNVYVTRASFTYVSGTPDVSADGGEYDSSTGVWTGQEEQIIFLFNEDADIQLVQSEAAAYARVNITTQGRGQTAVDGVNIDLENDLNGNPTGTQTVYVQVGGSLALTMTPDDARHELSTASYTESYWDADDNYHSDDTDFLTEGKANGSYTMSNIQHDCRVSIVYSWITHLISYHASGNGTINLVATYLDDDGTSATYDQAEQMYGGEAARDNTEDRKISIGTGGTVNMVMTADSGYKLSSLLVNDVEMVDSESLTKDGSVYTYTITPLTAAQTISATFANDTPEAYAALSEDGSGNLVLTFYYDTNKGDDDYVVEPFANYGSRGWDGRSASITSVVFDDTFANYSPTSTAYWFYGMTSLTSVSGLEWLSTDAVTTMSSMFERCSALTTLDLSNFQTSRVTNMANMFAYCSNLATIFVGSGWSTEAVQYSANMFVQCTSLAGGKGTTVTSTGADYARIDGGTSNPGYLTDVDAPRIFNVNVKIVGIGNVTATYSSNQTFIYSNSDNDISVARGEAVILAITPNTGYALGSVMLDTLDVTSQVAADSTGVLTYTLKVYDTHNITVTFVNDTDEPYAVLADNTLTFYYDKQKDARQGMDIGPFSSYDFRAWDSQKESITRVVFNESFANCTTITSTANWFDGMSNLATIEGIQYLKTDNVTDMNWMFGGCANLSTIELGGFNTEKVTNMSYMFANCTGLQSVDLSGFNAANVTDMTAMFTDCTLLANVSFGNSFNAGEVTTMHGMFAHCSSLRSLDLSGFRTEKISTMNSMFQGCTTLENINFGNFNTPELTDIGGLFQDCTSLRTIDLSSFNTANVYLFSGMFSNCSALTTIYVGANWSTSGIDPNNVMLAYSIFDGCTNLKGGAGTVYDETHTDYTYAHIDGGASNPGYLTDVNAPDSYNIKVTVVGNGSVEAGQTTISSNSEGEVTVDRGESLILAITPDTGYAIGSVMVDTLNVTSEVIADSTGVSYYTLARVYDEHAVTVTFVNNSPEAYAVLSENNTVLTFYYDTNKDVRNGMSVGPFSRSSECGWYSQVTTIQSVVFDDSFVNCRPTSTSYWFAGATTLNSITGLSNLNTSEVTSMSNMFYNCVSLGSLDLSGFNTDNVTDMSAMFAESHIYSLNISSFNTANVTTMRRMFYNTYMTELDVHHFNTANVTDMNSMFGLCEYITSLDLSSFNTSKVENMGSMFVTCERLSNLDISSFSTENVTDMSGMFYNCKALGTIDLGHFTTGNVTNMSNMFNHCEGLTMLDLSQFNTANVTNMQGMFSYANALTSVNLSSFNTSKVTDMRNMFVGCSALTTLDLGSFNTESVRDMIGTFQGCSSLTTINVSSLWSTTALTSSSFGRSMFSDCTNLVGGAGTTYDAEHTDYTYAHIDEGETNPGYFTDINAATEFDVLVTVVGNGSVSIGSGTIAGGSEEHITMPAGGTMTLNITPDTGYALGSLMLDTLDVTSQVAADSTGVLTYTLSRIYDTHTVTVTFVNNTPEAYAVLSNDNTVLTFYYDTNKESRGGMDINTRSWDIENGEESPYGGITKAVFDASFADYRPTSTAYWFQGCRNMTTVEGMENLNTSNVTDMGWMFSFCSSLTSLDVTGFNTQNVTDMGGLFYYCSSLPSIDVTHFNTTKVTNMENVFGECHVLTSVDVSNFNTENVTNMDFMFGGTAISDLDLSNFKTDNVTNMRWMFSASAFGVTSVLKTVDLSSFNTSKVENMEGMFSGNSQLTTILVGEGWNTSSVSNSTDMFNGCTSLVGGRGTTYDASHIDATYARIDMAPNAPGYFTRKDQLMGDANDDGFVTIADAVATVTNILGEPAEDYFSQTKADMNNDSEIDIFDVTLIVNAVLAASPAPAYNGGNIAAEDVRLESQANSLTMGISGSAPYTAFQFDVTLPEGTTLEGVRLANKATNHQLAYQKVGDNTYRVVGLSMTNQQLSAANGRLVQLQLSGNADESKVKMSNVLFVGQPATDATAIRNHVADGAADRGAIYDLNGRYVGNDRRQLSKGIYIINHKKVNIK